MEELIEIYKAADSCSDVAFSDYTALFIKFVSDSNPACLEKGVALVQIWCQKMNSLSTIPEPIELIKTMLEKALPNSRPVVQENCFEILSLFFEKGLKDETINAIRMSLAHKNPKVATFL